MTHEQYEQLIVANASRRSAAEEMDEIFGPGTAESMWQGDELEEARKPFEPPPSIVWGHCVRVKVGPSGLVSPAHPQAPLGRHNGVRVVEINAVPPTVPTAEVVRLYSVSIDISDSPSRDFDRLGLGRILR